jgi:hypothetical protein
MPTPSDPPTSHSRAAFYTGLSDADKPHVADLCNAHATNVNEKGGFRTWGGAITGGL